MATYNGNCAYLEWDGVDVSGWWTEQVNFEMTNETVDITAGACRTGRQRAAGLSDSSMSFMVVYDTTDLNTYVDKFVPGTSAVLRFGPEGNTPGKPKHEGQMILQSVTGPNVGVEKNKVTFELSFEQADDPTATIQGGGVF